MRKSKNFEISELNLDEVFSDGNEVMESRIPKILQIPLEMIDEFPDHPFQVRLDEDMDNLVESVKERGVITPVILRKKKDGRYKKNVAAERKNTNISKRFYEQRSYKKEHSEELRCLCPRCAADYRAYGTYVVRRADPFSGIKETCQKCGQPGHDYIIYRRPKNERGEDND